MQLKVGSALKLGSRPWISPASVKRTDASNDTTLAVDDELEKLKGDHEATMLAKEIVETGRSQAVDHAEQRLEKLLAEIALLEAKQAGMTAEQLAELEAREKKAREAEDRATKLRADAELHARTMLELQECELEKQRQAAEAEVKASLDKQRRDLLEYRHSLGLTGVSVPNALPFEIRSSPAMQRPGLPATGSILDDPAYRKLGPAEQLAVLDALEKDPTALISMGFGAYAKSLESSAAVEYKSAQKDVQYDPLKMPGFLCVTTETAPGFVVQRIIGPVSGSALRTSRLASSLDPERRTARSDMIRQALENGANAVLGVKFVTSSPCPGFGSSISTASIMPFGGASSSADAIEVCAYGTAAFVVPTSMASAKGSHGRQAQQQRKDKSHKKGASNESVWLHDQHQQPEMNKGGTGLFGNPFVPFGSAGAFASFPSLQPATPWDNPFASLQDVGNEDEDNSEEDGQASKSKKNRKKKGAQDEDAQKGSGWGWPDSNESNDKASNKQGKKKGGAKKQQPSQKESSGWDNGPQNDAWGNKDDDGDVWGSSSNINNDWGNANESHSPAKSTRSQRSQKRDSSDAWQASSIGKWETSSPAAAAAVVDSETNNAGFAAGW